MESMTKLMSKLVSVECAPHVHQNASNLVDLEHIAAAEFDATMKCKEGEEIALETKRVLDVNTDARHESHESVECTALRPNCGLALEHRLDAVGEAKGSVTK